MWSRASVVPSWRAAWAKAGSAPLDEPQYTQMLDGSIG
jgi:hypothetical protein